ncbi:hypothetical protein [Lysinibacillus fusiformis]|uniref:hypothetical protein n=1 Tax=Lysinibacillus fusiformis TaxID=28031 RepID=UPI003CF13613
MNVTILFISYKIEKEHKRVQAVIALVDYYVTIYQTGDDHIITLLVAENPRNVSHYD